MFFLFHKARPTLEWHGHEIVPCVGYYHLSIFIGVECNSVSDTKIMLYDCKMLLDIP